MGCVALSNCHKKGAQNKEPVIPDCFWKAVYSIVEVELTLFRHMGNDVTSPRVEAVTEAFLEILEQNVAELPPGSAAAWHQLLAYAGSSFRQN